MARDDDKKGARESGDADESAAKKNSVKLIKVRSALKPSPTGGDPVALSEKHPDHPGGEVFVYGKQEVEVAKTAAVSAALASGALVEV